MRYAFSVIAFALLGGCASVERAAVQAPEVSEERVIDKNYEIGKEKSAFVGDAMVRVKDYRVRRSVSHGTMRASRPFRLFYPLFGPTVTVDVSAPIAVVGKTSKDGVDYTLVRLPGAPPVSFLISADGRFEGSGLSPFGNARMGYTYRPDPPDVVLGLEPTASNVSEAGFVNYEIVYSGVTKDTIRLLYREYTPQDLVKPAFTQDLVYERDAPTIRFRSTSIRVIQATGERIQFAVLDDGYGARK